MKDIENKIDNLLNDSEEFYDISQKIYELFKKRQENRDKLKQIINELLDNVDLSE